jgi:hypothetical protein
MLYQRKFVNHYGPQTIDSYNSIDQPGIYGLNILQGVVNKN